MEISLVIPTYNEEKRIVSTIVNSINYLKNNFSNFEVIVVNDGSQDDTDKLIRQYNSKFLKIISYSKNMGKGYAVKKGVISGRGKYIFFTDADLPYSLDNIQKSVKLFEKNKSDIIIGSRRAYKGKHDYPYPLYRKIMSKAFSIYTNLLLNLGIYDTQCGFKGFTKSAADIIFPLMTINNFGFDVELLYIANKYKLKIENIPVNLSFCKESKVDVIRDSIKMTKDIIKIRYNDIKGIYN